MLDSNIIECKKLNKSYSGVHALKNFSPEYQKNSVVGLIGDNGAGKSTLIKILSGAHQQDTGDLFFENNKVFFKSTKDAMKLGIETIYQYLIDPTNVDFKKYIYRSLNQRNEYWQYRDYEKKRNGRSCS